VVSFRERVVYTNCGTIGADARPHWEDREPLPSLTGQCRLVGPFQVSD